MTALLNRQELYERLVKDEVQVAFTKVSGEKRIMRCTLDQSRFPAHYDVVSHYEKEELPKPSESGRMNVWDLDAGGWRSFLIENVEWVATPSIINV